jgi:hypothetical protein
LERAKSILSSEEEHSSESDWSSSDEEDSAGEDLLHNSYGRLYYYVKCLIELALTLEKQISYLQYKHNQEAPA